MAKAAILSRQPTDWLTPDVRSAALGIEHPHDLSFKFRNYLTADDFLRLPNREIRARKLANRPSFSSCSFCVYRPELCGFDGRAILPDWRNLRRANTRFSSVWGESTDPTCFSPNLPGWGMKMGCILRRTCHCSDLLPMARALFPVRRIWPQICSRVRKNDLTPPHRSPMAALAPSLIPVCSTSDSAMGIDSPPLLSHVGGWGGGQELKTSGADDAQIKGDGRGWGSEIMRIPR